MDSNPVQMTECWADTKQKLTSHASWVTDFAYHLVNTMVCIFCLFEIIWGVSFRLQYEDIVSTDYFSEAAKSLNYVIFKGAIPFHYTRYTSDIALMTCGFLILMSTIFAALTSRKERNLDKTDLVRSRSLLSLTLFLQIFVFILLIGLCTGAKDLVIFNARVNMEVIETQGSRAHSSTFETINTIQTIFRCCGADNASDWMKREDVSIPASCCARLAPNCTVVQKTALISSTAGPGLGTASDLPATLNLSKYNEGCDVTIRSYAYTSTVILCVNTFMLTLVWMAWLMRQRHRRVNSNLVFARHSRVSHKRRSSNNSALHDTGSGNERTKTSGKASTKVEESSLDKNFDTSVRATQSTKSITKYPDWPSIHRSAEDTRKELAANESNHSVQDDKSDDLSMSSFESVVW